jgi:hypothetical protein
MSDNSFNKEAKALSLEIFVLKYLLEAFTQSKSCGNLKFRRSTTLTDPFYTLFGHGGVNETHAKRVAK